MSIMPRQNTIPGAMGDNFRNIAELILASGIGQQGQQQPETVNIGGSNILVKRPNDFASRLQNGFGPALQSLAKAQIGMSNVNRRKEFLQGVQQIAQSNTPAEEKINGLIGLYSQHGDDYGLGMKEILDAYQNQSSTQYKLDKQAVDQKRKDFVDSTKVREEFINRPEVKEYTTIDTQVRSMDALLNSAKKGNVKNKVALDQALVTMYNKLTDPNSVVRESEYARTPENLPLVNRLKGAIQKVQAGGAGLTDSDREALVWGAKVIANERGNTFNSTLQQYIDLGNQYGIDQRLITRGLPPHKEYKLSTPKINSQTQPMQPQGEQDVRSQYNMLRSQGMSAEQAKQQLGIQ